MQNKKYSPVETFIFITGLLFWLWVFAHWFGIF